MEQSGIKEIEQQNYSAKQLRAWLHMLNKPTWGNKSALILRLNKIATVDRGQCPEVDVVGDGKADESEEEQSELFVSDKGEDEIDMELESIKKELENVRRERELLKKENNLLKRSLSKKHGANERVNSGVVSASLTVLKDIMVEYDGESDVGIWVAQFKNVENMYNVDESTLRALFVCKMKGKAQEWLQIIPDYASKNLDKLMQELTAFFGNATNKLQMRKKFENRKWQYKEPFSHYCNDKIALASALNMPEDELADYIVDGIPDPQLRTNANLLCINTTAQLLNAFSKIELKSPNRSVIEKDARMRCFNCNSAGHTATECKKPKREPGTCYGCGSKEHWISSCPQRKKETVSLVNSNEYVRNFNISLVKSKEKVSFVAECLIDSGSPVCFIRNKLLIKNKIEIKRLSNELNSYVGMNKTKIKIYGKIECFIEINGKTVNFEFLVIANESMGYDAILGRDFMRKAGINIVFNEEIIEKITSNVMENKKICIDNVMLQSNNENENISYGNDENENISYGNDENENISFGNEENENYHNNKIVPHRTIELIYKETTENDNFEKEILAMELIPDKKEYNLNIDEQIDARGKKEFDVIFEEYYVKPLRPETPRMKCELKLTVVNPKPFHCSPRRLSHVEKIELQKLLDDYLAKGYIRESSSEFASPIVLVKKKTGEIRMCIDFRLLNKITSKDNYPLPLIEDLIDKLGNKTYFTKLDLKNGYFHVFMHPDSTKLTSFVTPLGQYEFLRMPFGLKNAPSVFQRFINSIFSDMVRTGKIIVYMDDILIATETLEQHLKLLKEVFQRLVDNKLELRIDKCEFLQTQITYLGYSVTKNGIKPNEKGIEAIKKFPIPNCLRSVQSFLGLCSFFRKFVKGFSLLAKPLYDLTRKNTEFTFGEKELECFELLKKQLIKSPILAIYDPNNETELHTDASSHGFGAILIQRKEDKNMHPIFYFSKRTSETESKYHSFELETLAIIYALQRFRIYLQGIKFKIITDCNSLTLTLSKRDLNPRIARWALELQNYDYTIEHRSGNRMQHVDALSRNANVLVVEDNTFEEKLIICQGNDQILSEIIKELEKTEHKLYELRNGVLYRKTDKNNILFYVPKDMEMQIMHKYHDEMGHMGVNKTLDLIKKTYWFPKAKEKIETYIKNCIKCIAYSHKNTRGEGFLNTIPKGNVPFETIHIDHCGPMENNARSKKHIFVIIDAFSKFVRLYPVKTTKSTEAIKALQDYFRAYSRPKSLISDRGTSFTSTEFQEFMYSNNIKHIKVATGSPRANGQVERINRIIGPMIAKLSNSNEHKFWENTLQSVEFALNNTINRSVNEHASVLLFGVRQKGSVIDELKENFLSSVNDSCERDLNEVREKAVEQQSRVQTYNKKYFDRNRKRPYDYAVGNYVMLRNFDTQNAGPKKLIPKFKGPYKISKILRHNRFVIKDVDNFQQTNIPYHGVWAAENIRPWRQVK